MRNFIFSLVGTDGEEPITEEWLREWGGYCYDFIWRVKGITGVFYFDEDESTLVWQHIGNKTTAIHTRYQFRLLAAALGIKRKGE